MLLKSLLILAISSFVLCDVIYYDSFNASVLTSDQVSTRDAAGNTYWCVNAFEECDETAGRTIDGSCNNLDVPTAGAGHAPFKRFLPGHFDPIYGNYSRYSWFGNDLPLPREIRTRILAEGRVSGYQFTQLMLLFFVFAATDIAAMSIRDTLNYVNNHPKCCTSAADEDAMCYSIEVPEDDPVLRFTGITCLNITYPISFQSTGCLNPDSGPVYRMNYGTPFFDLSNMYGNDNNTSTRQRLFTGGLLNYTTTTLGKQWPQYIAPEENQYDGIQGLTGVNYLFGLWFWREHNRIAAALAEYNPCWDDETLFITARDINLAGYVQILYYEMFPLLMGRENMEDYGIISSSDDFRDIYDSSIEPSLHIEALLALRWVHTIQEGLLGLYNSTGEHIDDFPEVNLTLSTNTLNSANLSYYTQGTFRTSTGKLDNVVDPYVAELGLGPRQRVTDLTTNDLVKNRMFGVGPYVNYVKFCDGENHDDYESLDDYLTVNDRKLLQEIYEDVHDLELISALWLEKFQNNSYVPKTFYCLVSKQLLLSVQSDRHWYERADRPNAFTSAQLAEIRKVTVARLLCDNGDTVTDSGIPTSPFEVISDDNPLTSCDDIPSLDLSQWTDSTCSS